MDLKDLRRRAGIKEMLDHDYIADIHQQVEAIIHSGKDSETIIDELVKAIASRAKAAYNEGRTYGQLENVQAQRESEV